MRMVKCKTCGKVFPMNMSNCPDCFTKRSLPVGSVIGITICCVILAICLGSIIGILASEESSGGINSQQEVGNETEIQYIEVTANDIFSAFEENEVAAEEKFKGQLVKITGIVNEINSKSTLTSANILLKVDGSVFGCVQCNFNSEQSKSLANIKKGESVTIIGTCGGLMTFNVIINACDVQ